MKFVFGILALLTIHAWAESPSVSLVPGSEVANECSGLVGKPFRTYSQFGLGSDGHFYGLKGNRLVELSTLAPMDGSLELSAQLESAKATLLEFKKSGNITAENCPPAAAATSTAHPPANSTSSPAPSPTPSPSEESGNCHTAGLADSHVLALSWQPAFCEKKREKLECHLPEFLTQDQYQNQNFALHGLWPNKKSCRDDYDFCSAIKSQMSFDDYPAVELNPETESLLGKVMPSLRSGTHLERHEWYKHGSCQALDSNSYFSLAAHLTEEFNSLPVVKLLVQPNIGQTIKKADFYQAIDDAFGEGASHALTIICNKDGLLTEIRIPLKGTLSAEAHLNDLFDISARGYAQKCKGEFKIDTAD